MLLLDLSSGMKVFKLHDLRSILARSHPWASYFTQQGRFLATDLQCDFVVQLTNAFNLTSRRQFLVAQEDVLQLDVRPCRPTQGIA